MADNDITWEQAAAIAADITAGERSADDFLAKLEREERAKREQEEGE